MPTIILRDIAKRVGKLNILKNINLDIAEGSTFCLVGPRGAGKTSLLRLIAGLEKPSKGDILFDGKKINGLSPAKRNLSFIFDDGALYPTMTVYENIALCLSNAKLSKKDILVKVSDAAKTLDLEHCLGKLPKYLSNSQKLGVAIARALVKNTQLILFDNPSFLISPRELYNFRNILKQAQKKQSFTIIFATDEPNDAIFWGDSICLLKDGQIIQVFAGEEAFKNPANKFVSEFMGYANNNFLSFTVVEDDDGVLSLSDGTFEIVIPDEYKEKLAAFKNQEISLCINAYDIAVKPADFAETGRNYSKAIIENVRIYNNEKYIYANTGKNIFFAAVADELNASAGQILGFEFPLNKSFLFDSNSNQRIL